MKKNEKSKVRKNQEGGITLVALVVTIIILLILAGVAINMALGDNGLFQKSKEAVNTWKLAEENETGVLDYLDREWNNLINGESTQNDTNTASNTTSYVGYYADFDPTDGKIDGIIYADLALGGRGSVDNKWGDYAYEAVNEGLKKYNISETEYEGVFGPAKVIMPKGNGKDRFYVMALEDVTPRTRYCWYDAAYDDGGKLEADKIVEKSTNDFGKGIINTEYVMRKWDTEEWGVQNDGKNGDEGCNDLWGVIKPQVNEGWFLASKSEWSAFGDMMYIKFGMNTENYEDYGFEDEYWSSSMHGPSSAFLADVEYGRISSYRVDYNRVYSIGHHVRLSATF